MDLLDQASEAEERFREEALRSAVKVGGVNWQTASAKWCIEAACGQRIPDERRRAIPGVQRCVECQERFEKRRRT